MRKGTKQITTKMLDRGLMEGEEEQRGGGRTDGYTLQAPFRDGDSEANRQDTTQSHKRFHLSDKDRGRVCIVCIDGMQKTVLRHGHRSILRMPASMCVSICLPSLISKK